jgi:hypothetical protein
MLAPASESLAAPRFLTARWLRLVMVNFEVESAILQGCVPAGTELDSWNGRHFVSMVGFRFTDTRLLGFPVPLHRHFLEVNLRFYVRRIVEGEERRGVVFLKELVPRRALAWVARAVYNENYVATAMGSRDSGNEIEYWWMHRANRHRLGITVERDSYQPAPDSEERFITEHYWGYSRQRDGATMEYRVEHPVWKVWRGTACTFDCDVRSLYGPEFEEPLRRPPSSCFLADGSDIVVRRGVRLRR